jgi:N-glycosylase/DNA lyase
LLSGKPISHSIDAITSVNSGQTFLWEQIDDSWYGVDGNRLLKISVEKTEVAFSCYPEQEHWERTFFRLDDNMAEIESDLSSDQTLAAIVKKYPGLRLLRQDPEQCLFSFLCSSNTNIPMIRRMLRNLTRKFGKKIYSDGREFFAFPSCTTLASASIAELQSCGLGYRAKAVKSAAKTIASAELRLSDLKQLKYEEAKSQLLEVYGIGNKIADCILLFSLDHTDAFPIDVWIARALISHYSEICKCYVGEKLTARQYELVSETMRIHFGKYAGYAQQYLYYDIRQRIGRSW